MRTAPVTLALWLLYNPIASAESLSRGAAVARVLREGPQLSAARALEAQAVAHREQAEQARMPDVTLTAAVGPSLKAKLVPGTGAQSTENQYGDVGWNDLSVAIGGQLSVLQPLYTFGKIEQRMRAARHELKARRAQTDMTRAQLALTVAQLYEGLLFARDAERFFEETQRWLVRSREATQRALSTDSNVREEDVLRFDTGLAAISLFLHQASAAKHQAQAGLVAYLGMPTGTALEPREAELTMLTVELPSAEAMIARARAQRPELTGLAEASTAYKSLAEAEAAGNLPDLFALLFASGAYTPGRDVAGSRYVQDPLNGFYPGMLVGARFHFNGLMANKRADEQRAKAREASETLRWAAAGLPAEVVKAYEDAVRARADAHSSEPAVESAKRWSVRASADYAVGLGDIRELSDATQAFLQLTVAHYDAVYRFNVALAELTRATGGFTTNTSQPLYPSTQDDQAIGKP